MLLEGSVSKKNRDPSTAPRMTMEETTPRHISTPARGRDALRSNPPCARKYFADALSTTFLMLDGFSIQWRAQTPRAPQVIQKVHADRCRGRCQRGNPR